MKTEELTFFSLNTFKSVSAASNNLLWSSNNANTNPAVCTLKPKGQSLLTAARAACEGLQAERHVHRLSLACLARSH